MGTAILLVLFGAAPLGGDAADVTDAPVVVVRVDNPAAVREDQLAFAQRRAADVFSRIGVRVTWLDEETAFRDHMQPPFTVVLINAGATPLPRPGVVDALGFADLQVARAHVMYDRIEAMTARSQRSAASLLGDVIAHELGHLMLLMSGHSARGIMRSGVDAHLRAIDTFTRPQARQILARLGQVQ